MNKPFSQQTDPVSRGTPVTGLDGVPGGDLRTGVQAEPDENAIREAAYFLAQARGFEPGYELDDWVSAEQSLQDNTGSESPHP